MVATLLSLMRSGDKDATKLEAVKVMLSYLDGKPDALSPEEMSDEQLMGIVMQRTERPKQ